MDDNKMKQSADCIRRQRFRALLLTGQCICDFA